MLRFNEINHLYIQNINAMTTQEKINKAEIDCYRELYANSIGLDGKAGNFDELMNNASINEYGQKEIPFEDYYISKEDFERIVAKYRQQLPHMYRNGFNVMMYLGATPTCNDERFKDVLCRQGK